MARAYCFKVPVDAKKLKIAIEEKHMTQRQLCEKAGISPSCLQKVFREGTASVQTLYKIGKALHCIIFECDEHGLILRIKY